MKRFFAFILAAAFIAALFPATVPVYAEGEMIRVACVGDSITDGGASGETSDSAYPAQLQLLLDGSKYEVANCGKGGATAMKKPNVVPSYWDTEEYKKAKAFEPNIVTIMLGTNDVVNENFNDNATFYTDLKALVNEFKKMSSVKEIYLFTPPYAYDSNHPAKLEQYAVPTVMQIAEETDVHFVNMYELTKNHSEWFNSNDVHPNTAGARAFAGIFYEQVFGGKTSEFTVRTAPGNKVSLGSQLVTADKDGLAKLTVGDGEKTVTIYNPENEFARANVLVGNGLSFADCTQAEFNENLILTATVNDKNGVVKTANDGNHSSGWQPDYDYSDLWLVFDLGKAAEYDTVEIEWQTDGTRAKEGRYYVMQSSDNVNYTRIAATYKYTDSLDVLTFDSVTSRYIKLKIDEGTNGKTRPKVIEMRAFKSIAPYEAASVSANISNTVAQQSLSNDRLDIRFIAALDCDFTDDVCAQYVKVGFEITASDADHPEKVGASYSDSIVYDRISDLTGSDLGKEHGKLFCIIVTDVVKNAAFTVRAFAVTADGVTVCGEPHDFTVANGQLSD